MPDLTVLTWLWAQPGGRAAYTAAHVNVWAGMVRRHLAMPHRIACVTDMPDGIDASIDIIAPPRDFETFRIPTWGEDKPQCLRRVAMFRPDAADIFGPRFVSMDLDCIISGPLDPLFDRPEDIVLYRGATATRPYNGSMLMMTAGARPAVHADLTPERAVEAGHRFIGSDQAWISARLGYGEATWGQEHGIVWFGSGVARVSPSTRIMFFFGNPKPWDLVDRGVDDWAAEHYRGGGRGRCLVLGYHPSVWTDATAALATGPFDAVIASPEAAAHWPGSPIFARDDAHADRLARMHGFDEVVFCGRSEALAA
ncbi:hypothetical protein DK26_14990 [Bosea sp. WAO]|uniref:hypothetical protein n=1 Tax=Bosea sp. WAO TaxID=406341 RepID=UPI00074750B3|nr:hypothetical protein [Bosea sp. WAO]KUL94319.1 hypothetical protein DK26_14990 [Bosea sp. WAO]